MKLNLKRKRYKALGLVGIVVAVLAILAALIGDETVFKENIIAEQWEIVHSKGTDITEKMNALQYLAKRKQSLANINLSGKRNSMQGLDLSINTLELRIGVDLKNANFMHATLSEANFSEAYLGNAIFSNTDLSYARLHNVDLNKANLSKANLFHTNFSGAELTKAKLSGAKFDATVLIATDLTAADLSDAKLFAVNLTSANFTDVVLNESTTIDYAWIWQTSDEQHPDSHLPIGIPKNWDTTLKPAYVCSQKHALDNLRTKEQIEKKMKKNCQPYVPREESSQPQEQTADKEPSAAALDILSIPIQESRPRMGP